MFTSTVNYDIRISSALFGRLATACATTVLADWLFFRQTVGISLPIFLAVLGIVALAGANSGVRQGIQLAAGAAFAASLVALAEDVNLLSVTIAVLATALFATIMQLDALADWKQYVLGAVSLPFRGPVECVLDGVDTVQEAINTDVRWVSAEQLLTWIVPAALSLVFVALFASANPLIEKGVEWFDLAAAFRAFEFSRLFFWLVIGAAIWPIVSHRFTYRYLRAPVSVVRSRSPVWAQLLGEASMVRSLVLFNALFALQTGLDLAYLWGGFSLPDGMTYAQYAHRGAYPLIVTALLAAIFALIAMRPNGPADRSRLIRPLVLLFVAQNVILVISSMFRLDLYVAIYSLTYLRVAAFIWMLLVACGLVLMIAQIAMRKSTNWLLGTNAASLALVLYGCCFLNVAPLIADYNIRHSSAVDRNGAALDLKYLLSLGPQILPALENNLDVVPQLRAIAWDMRETQKRAAPANWRAFGFRDWRLERYIAATEARFAAQLEKPVPETGVR